MKLIIFFSWQMTTDTKFNKYFIKECIEIAVQKLEKDSEFQSINFEIQEGINRESGSPPPANLIMDKRIPNCDIFITDLTVTNCIITENLPNELIQLLRETTKPMLNPNVLIEYGIAYNALGIEKIIGIINTFYGSHKENNEILPFDLKHLRYPIDYNYSKNSKNILEIKSNLVKVLINAIKTTSLFAIQYKTRKYKPFLVWEDWEKNTQISLPYYLKPEIFKIYDVILQAINKPKQNIRILGLSGLGKTRLLLELFRPIKSNLETVIRSGDVLYLNWINSPNIDLDSIIMKLIEDNEHKILIIDNCPKQKHRQLIPLINRTDSLLSLISIDSNPEEIQQDTIDNVKYIVIKKENLAEVVDNILEVTFNNLEKRSLEIIKEFSQGIPLMAVLLGNSVKNGEQYIGKLDDKNILDNLLGEKGKNEKNRIFLKSCSLFNYFGYEDEFAFESKFIATNKNITNIDGTEGVLSNEFRDICDYFLKREIFEKRGRFIGMRPFPLTMYLAQEWLESCNKERLINVINDIIGLPEPHRTNLSEALAEQMKYMGYNDNAVKIIEIIIGENSPFDNAEVLNTELGSRFFRSFVEVNPVAVSQNFVRLFSSKSKTELLEIVDGRRNLIWTLEKLCFDKSTFSDSTKILYSFAVAENESWSNNATGQFLHLFNILLSGTESNLNERWNIILWGLNKYDYDYTILAINAMDKGLNYGHFNRVNGAELQGTKILSDYRPNMEEIKEYWNNILLKLTEFVELQNEYSDSACSVIANHIRSFCNAGLFGLLVPFLNEVSAIKNYNWDEGLKGLKLAIKYEKFILTDEEKKQVYQLIESLTKKDFVSRYITITNLYYLEYDSSDSNNKIEDDIKNLAMEFVNQSALWKEHLFSLYKNQTYHSFSFGKEVYEHLIYKEELIITFISLSLEVIMSIQKEERDTAILKGFLSNLDGDIKEQFYNQLYHNEEMNYLLFQIISSDKLGKKYFNLLFNLIDDKKCELICFYDFRFSLALKNLNIEELTDFCENIFKYGDGGYKIVFNLLYNLSFNDKEFKDTIIQIFKKCIIKIGINFNDDNDSDVYQWSDIICYILNRRYENEFAIFINELIINSINVDNFYRLESSIKSIFEVLINKYFNEIWSYLSKYLIGEDNAEIKIYVLKNILGSHIGGIDRKVGILFDGDIDTIFNWCRQNKPYAPIVLAYLAPIFGDNNNNYTKWNSITLRLIDEFGDIKDVLINIELNMNTYSWIGSIISLLEYKKGLFEIIENHQISTVSDWAKRNIKNIEKEIKEEIIKDEEMYR